MMLVLLVLTTFTAYKGYKAGYRNGLIHASLQFQLATMRPQDYTCSDCQ